MNLSPRWAETLENAGFQAVHWSSVGNPAAPDEELFEWAKANRYIVFTHDLDFGAILAATKAESPSVIHVRTPDNLPESLGETIIHLLNEYEEILLKGALITLDKLKERVRILPLG
jgi:predicted nuclease of predicted toxin-antitoxin system